MTLDQILNLHPRMRDAVQPPKLPRVSGQFSFKPTEDWQAFVAGIDCFRFRDSALRNWIGPFFGTGNCLEGFGEEGDFSYYDPTLEPQDGDLVLVAWGPESLAGDKFQRARADWLEKYGSEPGPIATKRLRKLGSKWILAVRNSFYWLDDSRILGVMVHRESSRAGLHSQRVCRIGPEAVTDTFVLVEPADGSQAYSAVTQPQIEVSGIGGVASYTSPANRSTEVKVSWSVQVRISNLTSGVAVGTSLVTLGVTINGSSVWDSPMTIESYNATDEWATFSGTRDFSVPGGQQIQVFLFTRRNFVSGGTSPAQTHFWQNALINLKAAKA